LKAIQFNSGAREFFNAFLNDNKKDLTETIKAAFTKRSEAIAEARKTKRPNGQKEKDQDNTYSSYGGSGGIGTSNSVSPPKSESSLKRTKKKPK
jgi:hypothetical protein